MTLASEPIRPACVDILKECTHMFRILTKIDRVVADRQDRTIS